MPIHVQTFIIYILYIKRFIKDVKSFNEEVVTPTFL